MRPYFDRNQIVELAEEIGKVHFEYKVSLNGGREFEVGYVYTNGSKELFCKRQPQDKPGTFYLCNQFSELK